MDYREFTDLGREIATRQPRQGPEYFNQHSYRLFKTFEIASRFLSNGNTVLSIGGGSAYSEIGLKTVFDIEVEVMDFPSAIRQHGPIYDEFEIKSIEGDTTEGLAHLESTYNLILLSEIIEHVPVPPVSLFEDLKEQLTPEGTVIVTTPNFASLWNLFHVIKGENISPDPEELFSEVSFEHEGIHRREYVLDEIEEAFVTAGLTPIYRAYMFRRKPKSEVLRYLRNGDIPGGVLSAAKYTVLLLIPRLRNTMCVVAEQS